MREYSVYWRSHPSLGWTVTVVSATDTVDAEISFMLMLGFPVVIGKIEEYE